MHTRFTVISSAVLDCAAPEVDVHARRDQGMDWMSNPEHAVKKSDPEAEAEVAKLFIYVNLYWLFNLGNGNPQWEKASQLVPWLLWRLWKNRNELVFRGREFNAQEVLRRAEDDLEEWRI